MRPHVIIFRAGASKLPLLGEVNQDGWERDYDTADDLTATVKVHGHEGVYHVYSSDIIHVISWRRE